MKLLKTSAFQTVHLFSSRGSRCLDARMSWHYIRSMFFFNLCRNHFPGLKKTGSPQLWMTLGFVICKNHMTKPVIERVQDIFFCQGGKLVSAKIWKIKSCHFWGDVMSRQPRILACSAFTAKELCGLKVGGFCSQPFISFEEFIF